MNKKTQNQIRDSEDVEKHSANGGRVEIGLPCRTSLLGVHSKKYNVNCTNEHKKAAFEYL